MSKTRASQSTTYKQRMFLAKEKANENMRQSGRKNWNEEDYDVMQKSFFSDAFNKALNEVGKIQ